MNKDRKEIIKNVFAISVLLIIIITVMLIMIQYQIEGEKNMPFILSKIAIISTAEGEQNTLNKEESAKWNLSINQNNDIYLFIDKNTEKDQFIEKVSIENIKITKNSKKGKIVTFKPSDKDGRIFLNKEEYIINDKLEYIGGKSSNSKILEIGNQGGVILIRFSNIGVGNFISNENQEVKHDGTLLNKMGVKEEEIKFQINFDIIIEVDNIKYKANITLNLPNDNIIEAGTTTKEIIYNKEKENNIVFKRVK